MKPLCACVHAEETAQAFLISEFYCPDLMGPPHHEVGEDRNPHNRTQKGGHKEFSGFLFDEKVYVKAFEFHS